MEPADAIRLIRACVDAGRVEVHPHFAQRMAERGLFWTDVLAALDAATGAREDGTDDYGRPRWFIRGRVADGLIAEMLAVLDRDEAGHLTVFITIYFER